MLQAIWKRWHVILYSYTQEFMKDVCELGPHHSITLYNRSMLITISNSLYNSHMAILASQLRENKHGINVKLETKFGIKIK